jgi:hypothetical protein
VGSFASGYRGTRESILLCSDRQARLRCGNRCRGTCTDPTGRAAVGSARPKASGCILDSCYPAFHFLCDLPSHLEVAQNWIGLGVGCTATDEGKVREGERRRDSVSWRMRLLPRPNARSGSRQMHASARRRSCLPERVRRLPEAGLVLRAPISPASRRLSRSPSSRSSQLSSVTHGEL